MKNWGKERLSKSKGGGKGELDGEIRKETTGEGKIETVKS